MEFLHDPDGLAVSVNAKTEDLEELDRVRQVTKGARPVVVNTHPGMAMFAREAGVPVVYLDIIPWMYPTLAEEVETISPLFNNRIMLSSMAHRILSFCRCGEVFAGISGAVRA